VYETLEKVHDMPYATDKGVRIYYEVEGQGPSIVFIPGFLGTLEDWRDSGYDKALRDDYRLILVDPRGRGGSDRPHEPDDYTFELMVQDIVAVLDDMKIDKASYFGYSMGAGIGFNIPVYAPERFYSLILGGSGYPLTGNEIRDDDVMIAIQEGLDRAIQTAPNQPMAMFVTELEKTMGMFPPLRRARMLTSDARALSAAIRGMRFAVWPKAEEVLPRITIPCLLFAGEVDTFYSQTKESADRIPTANFFSLPGLNHVEAAFCSDTVVPRVKEFLEGIDKSRS
jgi:pimeloyl-ACP methyl ester carboxylesterase